MSLWTRKILSIEAATENKSCYRVKSTLTFKSTGEGCTSSQFFTPAELIELLGSEDHIDEVRKKYPQLYLKIIYNRT